MAIDLEKGVIIMVAHSNYDAFAFCLLSRHAVVPFSWSVPG